MRVSERDRAFLVSAALHVFVLLLLLSMRLTGMNRQHARDVELKSDVVVEKAKMVWLPPRDVLRQLLPRPARPAPPRPKPQGKNRISVGPRSDRRARELLLPRDVDLTAVPKGNSTGRGASPAQPLATRTPGRPMPVQGPSPEPAAADQTSSARLHWPSRAADPTRPLDRTIGDAARHWGERLRDSDLAGLPSGTGQQIGPLFFDPAGADFTVWVNHFKDDVYRNWFVPQSVILGQRGRVDLQMTVDRSGKIVDLRVEHSTGIAALDRAAQNALLSSRLLPLPADYSPPEVTMRISFLYNMRPGQ